MSESVSDEEPSVHAPVPLYPSPAFQQNSNNQHFGSFHGSPLGFLPWGTQNQPSVGTTREQAPKAPSNTFPHNGPMHNGMPRYCMGYLPVQFLPEGPNSFRRNRAVRAPEDTSETSASSADNMPGCQPRNSSPSPPQSESGAVAHSSQVPPVDALQRREIRLLKNREAARECRRKKKEYVRCLEYRVAVLEKQNRTLIEELRALKDVYQHKVA